MKIGEKEKKKTGERSIDVYNRSKTKARPAGTIGQWYAIWFPLGTVMADRGYLGCSYSWCIINVGLTWPSRSTRIRRIAAKRPTADGPYKDPFYLCMCTGSLFQDKRWPGTRSPFCLWSSKPWTIPLSLSLSSFPFRRRITARQRVYKARIRGYPSLCSVFRILSAKKQLVFYSTRVPSCRYQGTLDLL